MIPEEPSIIEDDSIEDLQRIEESKEDSVS